MSTSVEVPVPAPLLPWIAGAEILSHRAADRNPIVHLPDGSAALTYCAGRLVVTGPRTRAGYVPTKEVPHAVRLRLRPGRALPVLGIPLSALTDQAVPLDELWGARAAGLAEELPRLGPGPALRRLHQTLLAHVAEQRPGELDRADLVYAATRRLGAPQPRALPEIARELGVSERHLRTLFTRGTGLTPRLYGRIARVRRALSGVTGARGARVASEAGYYDQSHMGAEFRALMGVSPSAYRAGRLPEARPCAALAA
ncbi:helix-turn-helix domain-containing protein [Streptomyces sp. NPDC052396]|uniref:AraC family transcriptional regulator n=1 Tax=Streptomyces sp. NPDC052396 TaxID=3365689 RepID=UPI0037D4D737